MNELIACGIDRLKESEKAMGGKRSARSRPHLKWLVHLAEGALNYKIYCIYGKRENYYNTWIYKEGTKTTCIRIKKSTGCEEGIL
ncbi:MAG TPA: hypothetical protein PK079_21290 [Leptospiraceae bacterium]|nr:hypothetical protein [Leptospiraceae bacterium]HMZ64220.1 hypothetical protein [Leptospiraceae bacterium]HNB99552.1 hypothetical protein [Leptospiraceae bacterium]HNE09736.1 hypothetical protein [Leptospiraceae bacterium]HNE55718.1 hypothetical protein [Leptospiraceae bacterium]